MKAFPSEHMEYKDGYTVAQDGMEDSHLYNAYKKFDDKRLAKEMLLRLFKKASEK